MFCRNCGYELPTGAKFCNRCGTKVMPAVQPEPAPEPEPAFVPEPEPAPEPVVIPEPIFVPEPTPRPAYTRPTPEEQNRPLFTPAAEPELPKENRPLSPWAYFGYSLLFMIPVIGLIPLIVFSFVGGNVNRRNFARSFWIGIIIVMVLVLSLLILVLTGVLRGPFEAAIAWLRTDGLNWLSGVIG